MLTVQEVFDFICRKAYSPVFLFFPFIAKHTVIESRGVPGRITKKLISGCDDETEKMYVELKELCLTINCHGQGSGARR